MRRKTILTTGLLAVAVLAWERSAPVHAQQTPPSQDEEVAASRALLDATGFAKQFDIVVPRIAQQLSQIFVKQRPERREEISEVFGKLVERFAARKSELYDKLAVLYAQHLPLEDLQELTRFYTSPIGVRFISVMPHLTTEAMQIGQAWGEGIGRELGEAARHELKKRGIDL